MPYCKRLTVMARGALGLPSVHTAQVFTHKWAGFMDSAWTIASKEKGIQLSRAAWTYWYATADLWRQKPGSAGLDGTVDKQEWNWHPGKSRRRSDAPREGNGSVRWGAERKVSQWDKIKFRVTHQLWKMLPVEFFFCWIWTWVVITSMECAYEGSILGELALQISLFAFNFIPAPQPNGQIRITLQGSRLIYWILPSTLFPSRHVESWKQKVTGRLTGCSSSFRKMVGFAIKNHSPDF